jgi:hypothetical protein
MFRYRRLRDARVVGQHPYGLFAITAQSLENRAASGIGQGLESHSRFGADCYRLHSSEHGEIITIWLLIVKQDTNAIACGECLLLRRAMGS